MTSADQDIPVLTKSQADCLIVLRNPGFSVGRIAVAAKLDLKKAEAALRKLEELGLAEQDGSRLWLVTTQGETCSFEAVPDRREPRGRPPGPGAQLMLDLPDRPVGGPTLAQPGYSAQRLLDLLDRPMRGRALARELGVSRERVRQLLIELHAQGRISFGDPDHPSWLVRRADDETPILSREEERVLSALPREHATDTRRLRVAAGLSEGEVDLIVGNLIAAGFAEAREGLRGVRAFRITVAGLDHPQYVPSGRQAPPPRLPVQSDRVRTVLQTISDAGALRIRGVKDLTKIPQRSINALMQYLKRKRLVAKAGDRFDAPYCLTAQGRATLAEMTLRQAA